MIVCFTEEFALCKLAFVLGEANESKVDSLANKFIRTRDRTHGDGFLTIFCHD